AETIDSQINQDWVEPDLFVPIKTIQGASADLLEQLAQIKGVKINEEVGRVYPMDEVGAHLIGYIGKVQADELEELEEEQPGVYTSTDMIGKRGLEQLYEKKLRGEKGVQILVTYENSDQEESKENVILTEKAAQDGEEITVTIDASIQKIVYNSYKENNDAGTTAVIDPKSGETL